MGGKTARMGDYGGKLRPNAQVDRPEIVEGKELCG